MDNWEIFTVRYMHLLGISQSYYSTVKTYVVYIILSWKCASPWYVNTSYIYEGLVLAAIVSNTKILSNGLPCVCERREGLVIALLSWAFSNWHFFIFTQEKIEASLSTFIFVSLGISIEVLYYIFDEWLQAEHLYLHDYMSFLYVSNLIWFWSESWNRSLWVACCN